MKASRRVRKARQALKQGLETATAHQGARRVKVKGQGAVSAQLRKQRLEMAALEAQNACDGARRYLAGILAAGGSKRPNQLGKALWAVCVHFGLSDKQAFELLSEWNAQYTHPLPRNVLMDEIRRVRGGGEVLGGRVPRRVNRGDPQAGGIHLIW
jgi:hypothetical protein